VTPKRISKNTLTTDANFLKSSTTQQYVRSNDAPFFLSFQENTLLPSPSNGKETFPPTK